MFCIKCVRGKTATFEIGHSLLVHKFGVTIRAQKEKQCRRGSEKLGYELGETQDPVPSFPFRAHRMLRPSQSSQELRRHNKYIFLHSHQQRELKHFFFLDSLFTGHVNAQSVCIKASSHWVFSFLMLIWVRLSWQITTSFFLSTRGS